MHILIKQRYKSHKHILKSINKKLTPPKHIYLPLKQTLIRPKQICLPTINTRIIPKQICLILKQMGLATLKTFTLTIHLLKKDK